MWRLKVKRLDVASRKINCEEKSLINHSFIAELCILICCAFSYLLWVLQFSALNKMQMDTPEEVRKVSPLDCVCSWDLLLNYKNIEYQQTYPLNAEVEDQETFIFILGGKHKAPVLIGKWLHWFCGLGQRPVRLTATFFVGEPVKCVAMDTFNPMTITSYCG